MGDPSDKDDGPRIDRRAFWRAALRGAARGASKRAPKPAPPPAAPPIMRPPGALPESSFLAACAPGCRACVDACPEHVIIPSLDARQPGGGDGRPYLLPDLGACTLCGDCIPACPHGALVPTPPERVRIGVARLDALACVRVEGTACDRCIAACPYPGTAIRDDDPDTAPLVDPRACTGCGLCVAPCPPAAITVHPRA